LQRTGLPVLRGFAIATDFQEYSVKRAYTLIELLVVIAVIALLMAILMPVMSRAREQAKIVVVNSELYNIGLALEAYFMDNEDKYPPTRADCMKREHFNQLPKELVEQGYLPPPPPTGTWMASKVEDKFNKGYTYKYCSVGEIILDRNKIHPVIKATLWIPDGFPDEEREDGKLYDDPASSPVTWVLYSHGPRFDYNEMGNLHYPVPTETWYNPKTRKGIITRMRLKNGRHIGSFERQ